MTIIPEATYGPGRLLEINTKEYLFYSAPTFYTCPTMAEGVRFRLISDGERICLCLEVNEKTRIQDISHCWYLVDMFREGLREIQGENQHGDNSFYVFLEIMNRDFGLSPTKIAQQINRDIGDQLSAASRESAESFKYKSALWKADDILRLSLPRMSDDERKEILMGALQNIRDNLEPFTSKNSPVIGSDIREKLRYRKKKRVGKTG